MSILNLIFARRAHEVPETQPSRFEVPRRSRPSNIAGSPSAECAAEMLAAPGSLLKLSIDEARVVVSYMRPRRIEEGTMFIREGDEENTGFMVLVLEGEVTVESSLANRTHPLTFTVLGPGSLIGEMGLLDGAPRSASCTAMTDLRCGVLTRAALNQLLDREPRIAAKLVMAISRRMAERMRDSQEKLKMYSQLTQAMNEEINELMPV
ncbi:MAG TPA: cyclic nucleotide-binding domain-containing protein [Ramlibacter sp.]|uniref:Crp/Fnr family transcriptional regulator n=1 Tax=Ramlibacter sp. TaxID=1917967 RepID=UPI002D1D8060|nr:cyclic nucleotide-binding domain-containing protein [Ramlibacter sp.]HVZ42586.1 cyclic nucleotide-binding domain-containing protein [Ramlibacter sp.]